MMFKSLLVAIMIAAALPVVAHAQVGAPRVTGPDAKPDVVHNPTADSIARDSVAFGVRMESLSQELMSIQTRTDLDGPAQRAAMEAAIIRARTDADALATRMETFTRTNRPADIVSAEALGRRMRARPDQVRSDLPIIVMTEVPTDANGQPILPPEYAPPPATPASPL